MPLYAKGFELTNEFIPHGILTDLIALNIVLDIIAIAIWGALPSTQWSIYRLGFSIVGAEAALAAVLFTLTLFGLIKRQKWAPVLSIAITATQRVFATYVFFPSPAIAVTLIWSLVIIYFAYKELNNCNQPKKHLKESQKNMPKQFAEKKTFQDVMPDKVVN